MGLNPGAAVKVVGKVVTKKIIPSLTSGKSRVKCQEWGKSLAPVKVVSFEIPAIDQGPKSDGARRGQEDHPVGQGHGRLLDHGPEASRRRPVPALNGHDSKVGWNENRCDQRVSPKSSKIFAY